MMLKFYNWFMHLFAFFPNFWEEAEEVQKTISTRKKHDCHKFTKQDYDMIMFEYNTYLKCKAIRGSEFQSTLEDVVTSLNQRLCYDKSRSAYTRVWTGAVSRESLKDDVDV